MFEFKHEIELQSSEKIKLFGEDYFGDKSTFWNAHQTTLDTVAIVKMDLSIYLENI